MNCHAWLATPPHAGGVAIIELAGDVERLLDVLALQGPWPIGQILLRRIAEVDTGLVVRISEDRAQCTPHGGLRIVERIANAITDCGATWLPTPPTGDWPEARNTTEAASLDAISRAESPLAIPLLLGHAQRWQADSSPATQVEKETSIRLNRLIHAPTIAVVGNPNTGKSTLLNYILGREAAIVSSEAGTTRDRVGAKVDIGGLIVNWIDTPGHRTTKDSIEREAIEQSSTIIRSADLRICLLAPDAPEPSPFFQPGDILVVNKSDTPSAAPLAAAQGSSHLISALNGDGVEKVLEEAKNALVAPEDLDFAFRWDFLGRM